MKKETEKEYPFFVSLILERKKIFQISYKTSILIENSDQYSTKGFQT